MEQNALLNSPEKESSGRRVNEQVMAATGAVLKKDRQVFKTKKFVEATHSSCPIKCRMSVAGRQKLGLDGGYRRACKRLARLLLSTDFKHSKEGLCGQHGIESSKQSDEETYR